MPRRRADDELPPLGDDGDEEPEGAKRSRARVVPVPRSGISKGTLDECAEISDDLQARLVTRLAPWAPVAGGYWATRAESNTRAVARIAAAHPRFAERILKLAEYEAYFELADFGAGLLVAIGVEARAMRYDSRLAASFGIDELAGQVEAEREKMAGETAEHYAAGGEGGYIGANNGELDGLMGEIMGGAELPAT